MKPDSRNTQVKDQGQRAAAAPLPPDSKPVVPPSPLLAIDLEAELATLAQEEQYLNQRKAERRQQYWDVSISALATGIERLVSNGFDRSAIAKALGIVAPVKTTSVLKKGTGPTTHDGWVNLFVATGIRSYLKTHPELASQLKADKAPSSAYASQIPPDALAAIQEAARSKAQSKCPADVKTSGV